MSSRSLAVVLLAGALCLPCHAADLTGVVQSNTQRPIPQATVYVWAAMPKVGIAEVCPNCYVDCGKRQHADRAGHFTIRGLDDQLRFSLLAVAEGFAPQLVHNVDSGAPTHFSLSPLTNEDDERTVRGRVVDPKGRPVLGAVIEPAGYHFPVRKPNGDIADRVGYGSLPGLDLLSVTNAEGEFALRMPKPTGSLDVRVNAPRFAAQIHRGLVPGAAAKISVAEGVSMTGRLLRDGKPLAGVPVVFVQKNRESSGYLGHFQIGTGKDGRFLLTDLPPGQEWVVFAPRGTLQEGVVTPQLVQSGRRGGRIRVGTMTTSSGRHIAGSLHPRAQTPRPRTIRLEHAWTGESWTVPVSDDGTFSFTGIPAGEVSLGLDRQDGPLLATPDEQPASWTVPIVGKGSVADIVVYQGAP